MADDTVPQTRTYPPEKFEEIKTRAEQIESGQRETKSMMAELSNMYWITDDDQVAVNPSAWGHGDIRYTKSPNARNEIKGLRDLVRTGRPRFSVDCDRQYKEKIEAALDAWWEASCAVGPKVHHELGLSAALHGECNLKADLIDDLLQVQTLTPGTRLFLEDLRAQTPILFSAEDAISVFPVYSIGMSESLRVTKMLGSEIKERWGTDLNLADITEYEVRDYYNRIWRCVWCSGLNEPLELDQHDLGTIPRFNAIADGTNLFPEQHRRRQPFLYAKWKAGLHKREDELLTSLFTSVYTRGSGPLAILDPDGIPPDGVIRVKYQGAFRYIVAKGQFADDKAFDRNLIELHQLLDSLGQRSTITTQTLGENIAPGTPYSGYAMASQNGRLPVLAVQEAVEKVILDGCVYALRRVRDDGVVWGDLKPTDIPADFRPAQLKVQLKVDLPQDDLRNAQVLGELRKAGVPLSIEFMHDFLQVAESEKMTFDWMSDEAMLGAFTQDLPNLIAQLLTMLGNPPPPAGGNAAGGNVNPAAPPAGGSVPTDAAVVPGGPAAAQAGAIATPATEPMDPTLARRGRV